MAMQRENYSILYKIFLDNQIRQVAEETGKDIEGIEAPFVLLQALLLPGT